MAQRAPVGRALRGLARRIRRASIRATREMSTDRLTLEALVLLVGALAVLSAAYPSWVPLAALTLPLYIGGLMLSQRSLGLFYALLAAVAIGVGVLRAETDRPVTPGLYLLLAVTAVVVLALAQSRLRLGLAGTRGQSMLVDLRDRLRSQGELPELPAGWSSEVVLRSAHGASFSGDFVVASRAGDRHLLEVAVVDVSGKGADAGTRALLLSGAFGGLLGALASDQFLAAANGYLLRQDWPEGFATAVHVVVDLVSGAFDVASAGHPPAVQFHAGSGRWTLLDAATGPLLGVFDDAEFAGQSGRLQRGDALLLYTDGLIETPGRDITVGIDRLVGQAEHLVTQGFRNGARRLVDSVGDTESDDRGLVLLWRE